MDDNIEVAIRIRPLLTRELTDRLPIHWQIDGQNIYQIDQHGKPAGQPFRFDHIFGRDKTNNEIFQSVIRPIIKSAVEGYNVTAFAYGQTASGKTYTMLGSDQHPGIMPLTINYIFDSINNSLDRKYLLRLSYIEIYNDSIYDLLDTTLKTIKIRENSAGVICLNVEEKIIHTVEQAQAILKEGNKQRRYGATNANQRSSRSHAIFRIIIESTPLNDDSDADIAVQVSHLNLVDLAGSERVSQSKATGARLREGGQINKSLHLLSLVIRQLSEGKDFTNYRDSKLTRILKESLGGNAKTIIIGAITPTSIEDSHSTLSFTYQAKKIKNRPTINEILDCDTLTKQYIWKEKELKKQLLEMAKDKKDLEDKHIRTVNELSDKLTYFRQQFIKSPKQDIENRRHTIGPSSFQKISKPLDSTSKCATVERKFNPRKQPALQSISEISLEENFPCTFNKLKKQETPKQPVINAEETVCEHFQMKVEESPLTESCSMGESAIAVESASKIVESTMHNESPSKELLETNSVLIKQIDEVNLRLKMLDKTNSNLKLELQKTSMMLEKTEDELLSLNEQLDFEENQKNKLKQAISIMMLKMTEKINDLKDLDGIMLLKNMLNDIVKSSGDLTKYVLPHGPPEEQDIDTTEATDITEENKNAMNDSIQSDPSEISSISILLRDLKILLCSDDAAEPFILNDLQENNGNCETDTEQADKQKYENYQGQIKELQKLSNHQNQAIIEKERDIFKKDTLITKLENEIKRNNDKTIKEDEIINNLSKDIEKLEVQISKLECENRSSLYQISTIQLNYNKQSDINEQICNEKSELIAKLNAQEEINLKLNNDFAKMQNKLTSQESQLIKYNDLQNHLEQQNMNLQHRLDELTEEKGKLQELNNKLIEEDLYTKETLNQNAATQTEDTNLELIQKNNLLEDHVLTLENNMTKQNASYIKLMEEQKIIQENLTYQEQCYVQLNEENNILQMNLDEQTQLNLKLEDEKCKLTEDINKHEQEISILSKENITLKETILSKNQLITEHKNKLNLVEKLICAQNEETESVRKSFETQLCTLRNRNAKGEKEKSDIYSDYIMVKDAYTKLLMELDKEKDGSIQVKQLNSQLTETNFLLLTKIAEYSKQAKEMVNSAEENSVLKVKLAEHEQLISKLSEEKNVLHCNFTLQEQFVIELNEKLTAYEMQLRDRDQLIIHYKDVIQELRCNSVRLLDQNQQQKLLSEYTTLRSKYKEQQRIMDMLEQQQNLFFAQSAEIRIVIDKFKFPITISASEDSKGSKNIYADDSIHPWEIDIKMLNDLMEKKEQELEDLDKDIIQNVGQIKHLEKIIAQQAVQISKLKEQQIAVLKSQAEVKKRRSITQDSSRNIEPDEEILPCYSCRVTNMITFNHALLRENKRKSMEIAKLECDFHNLRLNHNEESYKELNEEFEQLKHKYKQLKEVAIMRRKHIKSFNAAKIDHFTQT